MAKVGKIYTQTNHILYDDWVVIQGGTLTGREGEEIIYHPNDKGYEMYRLNKWKFNLRIDGKSR